MLLYVCLCVLIGLLCPTYGVDNVANNVADQLAGIQRTLLKYDRELARITSENVDLKFQVTGLTKQVNALDITLGESGLPREIQLLKQRDEAHKAEIAALQLQVREQSNDINATKTEMIKLASLLLSREDQNMKKRSSDDRPTIHVDNNRTDEESHVTDVDQSHVTDVNQSQKSAQQIKGRQTRLLLNGGGLDVETAATARVAFTAKLGEHQTGLGLEQTIVFERMQTNVGRAYSPDTGVFTAPLNGTYFFIATIMSHNGDYLETEIVHNGNHVVYMYSSDTKYEQGTNSAVLVLTADDHVWVRKRSTQGDQAYGNDWSTFSGFLLFL